MRVIGGHFGGRKLVTREGVGTRPPLEAVRQAMFNMVSTDIEGARVLDLFAGSGSMGIEAISRGAASCVMVESHRGAIKCIKENLSCLDIKDKVNIVPGRLPDSLSSGAIQQGDPFDLVLIDPPFDAIQRGQFLHLEEHLKDVLKPESKVMVRLPERFPRLPEREGFKILKERRYGISVVLVKGLA